MNYFLFGCWESVGKGANRPIENFKEIKSMVLRKKQLILHNSKEPNMNTGYLGFQFIFLTAKQGAVELWNSLLNLWARNMPANSYTSHLLRASNNNLKNTRFQYQISNKKSYKSRKKIAEKEQHIKTPHTKHYFIWSGNLTKLSTLQQYNTEKGEILMYPWARFRTFGSKEALWGLDRVCFGWKARALGCKAGCSLKNSKL